MEESKSSHTRILIRIHRARPLPALQGASQQHRPNPFAAASSRSSLAQPGEHMKRWVQEYELTTSPQSTLLDCLLTIKREFDPSLAFRYSCGHGMCGSDGVLVNGQPALLCKITVSQALRTAQIRARARKNTYTGQPGFRLTSSATSGYACPLPEQEPSPFSAHQPPAQFTAFARAEEASNSQPDDAQEAIELAPLPGFPVLRDLLVDIQPMMGQITQIQPYLQHQSPGQLPSQASPAHQDGDLSSELADTPLAAASSEYLQSPQELKAYELLSNCIACGLCEAACPIYAGGEAFIGPAALVASARFIRDSRDSRASERLQTINQADGLRACQSVRACTRYCPRGIDIADTIWSLIKQARQDATCEGQSLE
ncbi:(2Fe-2S)-binding protein [Bombiscardovia nodaiensis]|uniref:succinate dehydrogenase n=1 Tax=Bombiscardovia nodaiensis TaxID=2932181 RepID=A0ABM8B7K8_9BIFI|nr:(2Fe-2S)-binding protein [Bombiscardovia nodaiensis]